MDATLKQFSPGYIDRDSVAADALSKDIDAMRVRLNTTPLQGARLFRTVSPRGGVYKESQYGDKLPLPFESEDSASLPFGVPFRGYNKSLTVVTYRLGIQVERALTEDELFPVARKMAGGLMTSARYLLEYEFANVFNNATSSSYTGADGVALVSASHPFERVQQGNWSNSETSAALTHATYSTARKNLRRRKDEWNNPNSIFPSLLVVVPEKEQAAREIMVAEKVPENALNQPNIWRNECEVFVWDYLTSTTAWFILGKVPEEYNAFMYAQAVPPTIAPLEGSDKSTDIIWGERVRMRYAVGWMVPKELEYNAGA